MQLGNNLLNQFISPYGSNRLLVEQTIQKVTTQLLDFLTNAGNKPTNPALQLFDTNHFKIPDFSQTETEIKISLQEFFDLSMNPANPKYIGHMDSMPTLWAIIGDYVASALNNNLLSLEMSPFITQLEYSMTRQFAELFGLPNSAGGVILSGGALLNLEALLIARNTKLKIKNGNVFSCGQVYLIRF